MGSSVDWVLLDHTAEEPVKVGDMVSTDAGGMPIFRVANVEGGKVWVGDERHSALHVMSLDALRWKAANV